MLNQANTVAAEWSDLNFGEMVSIPCHLFELLDGIHFTLRLDKLMEHCQQDLVFCVTFALFFFRLGSCFAR